MKIDIVTFSCNNNPLFYQFWNPVSKLWKEKFDVRPILAYCIEKTEDPVKDLGLSVKYGDIYTLPPVHGIPSYILAAWGRFYITRFFPNQICLESDIDLVPLSHKYFIDDIKHLDDDVYHNLDFGIYNDGNNDIWKKDETKTISGCYHLAKGSTFNKIFDFLPWKEEIKRLNQETFPTSFAYTPEIPKWALDELYVTKKLREAHWLKKVKIVTANSNYNAPNVDRSDWTYDPELVKQGYYMDSHMLRPYEEHKSEIDKLLDLVPNEN